MMHATADPPFNVIDEMAIRDDAWRLSALVERGARLPRRALMGLIWIYQSTIGPALPPACRYQPSCSHYAYTAIERYGVVRGSWLTIRRLARCQPWGGSGYDPVP